MQANWSLILNVLLLVGVVAFIFHLMKAKKKESIKGFKAPPLAPMTPTMGCDDIIAVRKILSEEELLLDSEPPSSPPKAPCVDTSPFVEKQEAASNQDAGPSLMMFLLAKGERQLVGYELLQTLLSVGLRFGEGHLFHRHQFPNGQGTVLFSVAAATPSGIFDMQNIGAFSVRGLCLFMQPSGNSTIDAERFSVMLDTAKQLSEGLDTYLLDDNRKPLTDASVERYYQMLHLSEASVS